MKNIKFISLAIHFTMISISNFFTRDQLQAHQSFYEIPVMAASIDNARDVIIRAR